MTNDLQNRTRMRPCPRPGRCFQGFGFSYPQCFPKHLASIWLYEFERALLAGKRYGRSLGPTTKENIGTKEVHVLRINDGGGSEMPVSHIPKGPMPGRRFVDPKTGRIRVITEGRCQVRQPLSESGGVVEALLTGAVSALPSLSLRMMPLGLQSALDCHSRIS